MALASSASAAKGAFGPPASTFADLLRRSRFASYDPSIAQTWSSPPAHARRGDYGLKRPIPMTYKDSYISLNTFEHHAHFAEWNNAEAPVKFLKRIEETNITTNYTHSEVWATYLGQAASEWIIDSEFAPRNYGPKRDPPIDGLGRRGPGAYGYRRPPPQTDGPKENYAGLAQVNIDALLPRDFRRYLSKLRKLSPQFRKFVLEEQMDRHESQLQKGLAKEDEFRQDEFLLYTTAQNPLPRLHRRFLAKLSSEYTKSEGIERRPHQNGALSYTHYSTLETVLTTKPQPGIILQVEPKDGNAWFNKLHYKDRVQDYVSLFAGIVTSTQKRHADAWAPFYNPQAENPVAVKLETALGTTNGARVPTTTNTSTTTDSSTSSTTTPPVPITTDPDVFLLYSTPLLRFLQVHFRKAPDTVVGYKAHLLTPNQHLNTSVIKPETAADYPTNKRNLSNPHRIGSMEYSGYVAYDKTYRFGPGMGALGYGQGKKFIIPGEVGKEKRQALNFKAMTMARRDNSKVWRKGLNKDGNGMRESASEAARRNTDMANALNNMLGGGGDGGGSGGSGGSGVVGGKSEGEGWGGYGA